MIGGKKCKVPRLCFMVLQWEHTEAAFNYWDFLLEKKPTPQTKELQIFSWTIQECYNDFTISFGTWARKSAVTFPNNIQKILTSWTKAATVCIPITQQSAGNSGHWISSLVPNQLFMRQMQAGNLDFLQVLTELLNCTVSYYYISKS